MYRKVRTILVPHIFLTIISYVFNGLTGKTNWTIRLIDLLSGGWFLTTLFLVSLIWWFLYRIIKNDYFCLAIISIDLILIYLLDYFSLHSGINLEIVPMSLLFYMLGYFTKIRADEIKIIIYRNNMQYYWIVLLPIVFITSQINSEPVCMYLNSYGNLVLFFISSTCGICMVGFVAKMLEKILYLKWIGKNTIVFYVFNFMAVDSAHMFHNMLKMKYPVLKGGMSEYIAALAYLVLIVIVLSFITLLCNRYLWFIFTIKSNSLHHLKCKDTSVKY